MMEHTKIYGWNGIRYSAADVSLVVVPELGGRIISLSVDGQEIFFVQKEHAGETFSFSDACDLRREKQKLGFRFWGGDKTWIAPERDWWEKIPPLQLDAGGYDRQISGNGIKMISPVCGETGLQIKRTVSISHDGTITLDQEMTNYGHGTVCKGIWNVTQLLRPCDVYLPTKKENIRSYHKEDPTLPDHCVVLAQEGDLTCIPCRDSQVFKFGGMIDVGQVLCLCDTPDGQVALLKIFSVDVKGRYLHRSMIEIFNSNIHGYLEVEIHAPGAKLKSGDFMSHSQEWRLKRYPRTAGPQDIYIDLISRRT